MIQDFTSPFQSDQSAQNDKDCEANRHWAGRSMLQLFQRYRTHRHPGVAKRSLRRHRYKDVWNSASLTERAAKLAVASCEDETVLAEAAEMSLILLQESIGVHKEDVILEIGCGVGRVGSVLAPVCRKWIGVDASDNMIKFAKKRLKDHPNVQLISNNGYDLAEIESNTIDVVYCTVVMMHLSQWDRYGYIKEAYRVLRSSGRIFIDNVNLTSDDGWKFFEEHAALRPQDRPPNISELSTPQELETFLLRAGFKEIRHELAGLWVMAYGKK